MMCMRAQTLVSLFVLGLTHAVGAQAVLCKYVDGNGGITYSDSPVQGARMLSCFGAPPPPSTSPATVDHTKTAPPPATVRRASPGGGLPSVDADTQKRRDDSRRKILEEELAIEETALAQARKDLAGGQPIRTGDERSYQRDLDRAQQLKNRVSQHERNISAVKQELANIR
jgi:hypothetical protein